MITKTEVLSAIARCEPHAGFATIDNRLVHPGAVSRGDLFALIEAAKCARYEPALFDARGSDQLRTDSDYKLSP